MSSIYTLLYEENDVSVYDKDHTSELRIKNRSERDKKQCMELKEKCSRNKPIRMAASTAFSDFLGPFVLFLQNTCFSQLVTKGKPGPHKPPASSSGFPVTNKFCALLLIVNPVL